MPLATAEREGLIYQLVERNNILAGLHTTLGETQSMIAMQVSERNNILALLAADQHVGNARQSRDLIAHLHTVDPPPTVINPETNIFPTGHSKIPTHLEFVPLNTERFVTTGKDGQIKLWQLDPVRSNARELLSVNALMNDGLYPEDISVNPYKENLVAVYGKSDLTGSTQMIVVRLKDGIAEAQRVQHVTARANLNGILRVEFMPWKDGIKQVLVTSGDDPYHRLICWTYSHQWAFRKSHQEHSSRITGFCGLFGSHVVVSVGRDRKVVSFDIDGGGLVSDTWKMKDPGLNVIANPVDYNLVCVQTTVHKQQLRLVDLRESTVKHGFGWSQQNTTKQSSFVTPEWSPNGWLLSSGSSDSFVHVFDIRYNKEDNPTDSFPVHHKRVCKAAWHPYRNALLSISSDFNIGYLKLTGARISSV